MSLSKTMYPSNPGLLVNRSRFSMFFCSALSPKLISSARAAPLSASTSLEVGLWLQAQRVARAIVMMVLFMVVSFTLRNRQLRGKPLAFEQVAVGFLTVGVVLLCKLSTRLLHPYHLHTDAVVLGLVCLIGEDGLVRLNLLDLGFKLPLRIEEPFVVVDDVVATEGLLGYLCRTVHRRAGNTSDRDPKSGQDQKGDKISHTHSLSSSSTTLLQAARASIKLVDGRRPSIWLILWMVVEIIVKSAFPPLYPTAMCTRLEERFFTMVWDNIPKDEARLMANVWAVEDGRSRRKQEAKARRGVRDPPPQDDPPSETEPLEGSTAWPPQAMLDELGLLVGEFGLENPTYRASDYAPKGEHVWGTWEVTHSKIHKSRSHATGCIIQGSDGVEDPMNVWSIYIDVDIKGSQSFKTSFRWEKGQLTGSLMTGTIGLIALVRSECQQCFRNTVIDGPYKICIPCCQRRIFSGNVP